MGEAVDGLLGLGMGVERAERETMRRPPYSPREGLPAGASPGGCRAGGRGGGARHITRVPDG